MQESVPPPVEKPVSGPTSAPSPPRFAATSNAPTEAIPFEWALPEDDVAYRSIGRYPAAPHTWDTAGAPHNFYETSQPINSPIPLPPSSHSKAYSTSPRTQKLADRSAKGLSPNVATTMLSNQFADPLGVTKSLTVALKQESRLPFVSSKQYKEQTSSDASPRQSSQFASPDKAERVGFRTASWWAHLTKKHLNEARIRTEQRIKRTSPRSAR